MINFIFLLLSFTPFFNSNYDITRRNFLLSEISKPLYKYIIHDKDEKEDSSIINNINNNLYYTGPLTDESIFAISSNIIHLQNHNIDSINLHIQSAGGSLLPSLGLVDLIRTSDIPINTYIEGYAASAATLISAVGAQRFINKHGVMLIHQLKMGSEYSKYNEIKDFNENAETLMNIIREIYLEYSNIKADELEKLLEHDLWLNSSICKQYGFIDLIM